MKVTEDYKYWLKTKQSLINELLEAESIIFNRIESVYNTLNYYMKKELNEDETMVFNVGYMYLSEQILAIENHIKILGSLNDLEEQSIAFNYLLDVNDFYEDHDLKEHKEEFLGLVNSVEDLLHNKKPLSNDVYEKIEALREQYSDTASVLEIFEEISESLGV